MKPQRQTIENYLMELQKSDPEITEEIQMDPAITAESVHGANDDFMFETIVLTKGRPVLDVKAGEAVLDITEVESRIWKDRLAEAGSIIAPNIAAVGRIELVNHPRGVDWIGTGWVIRDDIVVTNRHVAETFGYSDGSDFIFRPGFDGGRMQANIDFLEEFDNLKSSEFPVFKIMHIEDGGGPDIAFLRIEPVNGAALPSPVSISSDAAKQGDQVAVIGYPARDPFFPKPDVMDRIFNHRYDKKRLAPGLITGKSGGRVFHDCTTLGGNSGGEVVSLKTGKAVALHFAGTLFTKNHAVPIDIAAQRLDDVLSNRIIRRTPPTESQPAKNLQSRPVITASGGEHFINATIPITVRIELGDITTPSVDSSKVDRPLVITSGFDTDDDIEITEARPEDFINRDGYNPEFLGSNLPIPLPLLTENQNDTLTFDFDGKMREVLDYRHFSVLMSTGRRLCRYSACNIDGRASKRTGRKSWRFDPRISKRYQIMKRCYGNLPKFSRGHMTRREDPAWGSVSEADEGNVDSMHVTNTVPQIQPFNGGIWLDLEDYALQNARKDDMRISVFTGPFLENDDPVRFGVKIPITFWKVIAFIHDETGELCATGYTMSQNKFIGEEEFVFGQHENNQRPIAEIGARAGISFGPLAAIDPLKDADESTPTLLTNPNQIRWV